MACSAFCWKCLRAALPFCGLNLQVHWLLLKREPYKCLQMARKWVHALPFALESAESSKENRPLRRVGLTVVEGALFVASIGGEETGQI